MYLKLIKNMVEKHFQTFFGKYLTENPPQESEFYELKMTSTKSIRFDSIKPHQREALLAVEDSSLYHKISDSPIFGGMRTRFTAQKPFDCFCVTKAKAFVVVWFYVPRHKKVFVKIRIKDFLKLEQEIPKKSFRFEDIGEHGEEINYN